VSGPPVLSLQGVSKRYRAGGHVVQALDETFLDFQAGEVTGIVGPSGSGKTTLLMVAGLIEPPTTGAVLLDGTDMSGAASDMRALAACRLRHFGFVFQKPNLVPFLDAIENVEVAMHVAGVPMDVARRRALSLMEQMNVAHRAHSMPNQISGGEQQRVAICRSLANRPRVLLADEPTASLDSERARQVMDLFSSLARNEGVGVITVTHDLRWTDFFDQVVEMRDGRIVVRWAGRREPQPL
jgi:putative ABC transport system ATP-binding protein